MGNDWGMESGTVEYIRHFNQETAYQIRNVQVMQIDPFHFNVFFTFDGRMKSDQAGEALVTFYGNDLDPNNAKVDVFVTVTRNGKHMRRKMKQCVQKDSIAWSCVNVVKQPDLFN